MIEVHNLLCMQNIICIKSYLNVFLGFCPLSDSCKQNWEEKIPSHISSEVFEIWLFILIINVLDNANHDVGNNVGISLLADDLQLRSYIR